MLYYEAVCNVAAKTTTLQDDDKEAFRETIMSQTKRFQRKNRTNRIFVSDMKAPRLRLMLAVETAQGMCQLTEAYLRELGFSGHSAPIFEEITLQEYCISARRAEDRWILDEDDFIPDFYTLRNYRKLKESILKKSVKKEARRTKASKLLLLELVEEMHRIEQTSSAQAALFKGHPVHYCLCIGNEEVKDEAVELLLMELVDTGRLRSRRYVELMLNEYDRIDKEDIQRAFQTAEDNALIVTCEHDGPMSEYSTGSNEALNHLCTYARQFRHSVLLVLCLRKENVNGKRYLLEEMSDASFVEIKESTVNAEKARSWLRAQARALGAHNTATLTRQIENGKTYSVSQLIPMVNLWRGEFLRNEVYPQYTHLTPTRRQEKPEGCAYDRLTQMIGLGEAKALLLKAVNLHKMRGEYARHGVSRAMPSMHMVFSGNPGTAKTTVARLFAQIMKDNGLLEAGELFEVGRADLVGKYVGHTAPLVKSYFEKAKGSVLFIDEAYALLDGRDGLYGDEAINTIVQEMERMRNEVVVIFAGYKEPMDTFLQRNPGLRSRIAFHVDFPDYTQEELFDILMLMANEQGLSLGEGAEEKALEILHIATKVPDFGNGRYVRNMLEQARMNQASRLSKANGALSLEQVSMLEADDFAPETRATGRKIAIGF